MLFHPLLLNISVVCSLNLVDSSQNTSYHCSIWYCGQFSLYFAFLKLHFWFPWHNSLQVFFYLSSCFFIPMWAISWSQLLNFLFHRSSVLYWGKLFIFSYGVSVTLTAVFIYSRQPFPLSSILISKPKLPSRYLHIYIISNTC